MESIIIGAIILIVVILGGRSIYLTLKGKKNCSCANKGCAYKNCSEDKKNTDVV